ncbi:MAG: SRPBCC family protein [Hyphomicrobium sp.]
MALWKKIGDWCSISDWHPSVLKCIEKRDRDQLLRVLTFKDGNSSKEKLLEKGTTSYKYEILETTFPVDSFQSMFSVSPDDEDLDELHIQWSATYDAKERDDKEVRKQIDKVLSDGIANLKKKFDPGNLPVKDTD